jgi:DNA polymerase-3 subunit epsilon
VSIELAENSSGYLQARLVWEIEPHRLGDYFGLFRSKKDAEKALSGIAAKNDLCNKLLGLEPDSDGPCFQRSLGRCRGACDGGEDVARYNLRAQIAFHGLRLKTWPWKGPVVATLRGMDEIDGLSLRDQAVNFDLDSYKLVVKALMGQDGRSLKVIELDAVGAPDVLMP